MTGDQHCKTVGGVEQYYMSVSDPQPAVPKPSIRWYCLTQGRMLAALLAVEGVLSVANWFCWFPPGLASLYRHCRHRCGNTLDAFRLRY